MSLLSVSESCIYVTLKCVGYPVDEETRLLVFPLPESRDNDAAVANLSIPISCRHSQAQFSQAVLEPSINGLPESNWDNNSQTH